VVSFEAEPRRPELAPQRRRPIDCLAAPHLPHRKILEGTAQDLLRAADSDFTHLSPRSKDRRMVH